jgi:dynactin complex subunit
LGIRVEPPTRLKSNKVSMRRKDEQEEGNVHNVVDVLLLEVGVLENLLDGLHGLAEEVEVQLLKFGAGEGLGEVLAVEKRLDLELR